MQRKSTNNLVIVLAFLFQSEVNKYPDFVIKNGFYTESQYKYHDFSLK